MDHYLDYEGSKIFYRVTGMGQPVILLHGFPLDGNIWQAQEYLLKDGYKVIIPDLPGSGKSENIPDMSMEGMAEVIHAIIHKEDISRCTVIGHSMGGYITLALAEKYPNHVNAIGLFHSTAYADSEEKKLSRKKGIASIQENGSFAFLKILIPNLFSENSLHTHKDVVDRLLEKGKEFKADTLAAYYMAMMRRPDRTNVLKNTELPVLFMMGEHDKTIPLSGILALCYLPEKSYIHILKDSAHMGMVEEHQKSGNALKNFLNDLCVNTITRS